MILVENNHVRIGISDCLPEMAFGHEIAEKMQLFTDLTVLYSALVNKMGQAELAELIERSLHVALEVTKTAEVQGDTIGEWTKDDKKDPSSDAKQAESEG